MRVPSFELWLATAYVPIAGAETAEATPAEPAAEGAPEEGGGEQTPAVDFSPLQERMDEVLQRVGGVEQQLQQTGQQPPEDELDQYGQPLDPGQGWDTSDPNFDPADPETAQRILQAEAQRAAQAAIAPELERMANERRQEESEALLEDYPELQETPAAQALVNDAQQWASDVTRDIARGNPQLAQSLATEPAFLELVHLAGKQAAAAESEATPPGQSQDGVTLEGGAPANPGGGTPSQPLGEQIKSAGNRNGFWTG